MEPVYLEPQGAARLTEYGKRWMCDRREQVEKHWAVIADVLDLARIEHRGWEQAAAQLVAEGVPTALTGMTQYAMAKAIDASTGKTTFTAPGTVALALTTVGPTTASTGASITEATYTTYARLSVTAASWTNAATGATPSVSTNAGILTFAACTALTSTVIGLVVCDSASTGAGNALWAAAVSSVVISSTQTPPTVAATALSLSVTGS